MYNSKLLLAATIIAGSLALTACGGGGGSGGGDTSPTTPTQTPAQECIAAGKYWYDSQCNDEPKPADTEDQWGIPYELPEVDYNQGGVVFYQDFNAYTEEELYTTDLIWDDFNCDIYNTPLLECIIRPATAIDPTTDEWVEWQDPDGWMTVKDGKMTHTTPANYFGSSSIGFTFGGSYDEIYASYEFTFAEDFDFGRGGKLPGLSGLVAGKDYMPSGGNTVTGYNGFTARFQFDDWGDLSPYVYHMESTHIGEDGNTYGEGKHQGYSLRTDGGDHSLEADGTVTSTGTVIIWERGRTYTLEQRIKLNDVGESNGEVEVWINGVRVFFSDHYRFRETYDITINHFYLHAMHGGNDETWAVDNDSSVTFDNIAISETPLTH